MSSRLAKQLQLIASRSGGVRGILEILVLEKIEQEVGYDIPIQDLFDLVVGTSTGELLGNFLYIGEYGADVV